MIFDKSRLELDCFVEIRQIGRVVLVDVVLTKELTNRKFLYFLKYVRPLLLGHIQEVALVTFYLFQFTLHSFNSRLLIFEDLNYSLTFVKKVIKSLKFVISSICSLSLREQ